MKLVDNIDRVTNIDRVDIIDRVDQIWKKFVPFWAPELGDKNPSADFLLNVGYKEGTTNICNQYVILQKEFPLPEAEILLWQTFLKKIHL